jgi:hypothetical protein
LRLRYKSCGISNNAVFAAENAFFGIGTDAALASSENTMSKQRQTSSFTSTNGAEQSKAANNPKPSKRRAPRRCALKPTKLDLGLEPLPKR